MTPENWCPLIHDPTNGAENPIETGHRRHGTIEEILRKLCTQNGRNSGS
jgi:hypothetical protein